MSELYTWDQTLNEVHISFKIDEEDTRTSIKYLIKDRRIEIIYNDKVILKGHLTKRVDVGAEFWVKNEDTIDFYLTKQKNDWWESLLEGSEKVDINKLAENTNSDISNLDPEALETLERMAYEAQNGSRRGRSNGNE